MLIINARVLRCDVLTTPGEIPVAAILANIDEAFRVVQLYDSNERYSKIIM